MNGAGSSRGNKKKTKSKATGARLAPEAPGGVDWAGWIWERLEKLEWRGNLQLLVKGTQTLSGRKG
jgi:hypothetical protein